MPRRKKTCHKFWSDEELRKEALRYNTRYEFQVKPPNANRVAHRRGIIDDICSHMKVLRQNWTDEELMKEALKYDTRISLKTENQKVYAAIRKRNLEDMCYGHMQNLRVVPDTVYIWKVSGLPVYKVGVTTSSLGESRKSRVCNAGNLVAENYVSRQVEKPFSVEVSLLSVGRPFLFDSAFDGSTEFRNMTEQEYQTCLLILYENAIQDSEE